MNLQVENSLDILFRYHILQTNQHDSLDNQQNSLDTVFRYHNLQTNLQPNNLRTENILIHVYKQLAPLSPKIFSVGNKRNLLGLIKRGGGGYNQYSQYDSRAEKGKEQT